MELELQSIIEEREKLISFNTSVLEDINEKILIETKGYI